MDREWTVKNNWATWAELGLVYLTFSFSFIILLNHCEVTSKNIYLVCTNIFFIYNRLHISCFVEVSKKLNSFTIFNSLNEFLHVYRK